MTEVLFNMCTVSIATVGTSDNRIRLIALTIATSIPCISITTCSSSYCIIKIT